MNKTEKILKICEHGHRFYKTANCNSYPTCEKVVTSSEEFLSVIVIPARRALERDGIISLSLLSKKSEKEMLELLGMGRVLFQN